MRENSISRLVDANSLCGKKQLELLLIKYEEIVRLVPVGSFRVEMVDRVVCP